MRSSKKLLAVFLFIMGLTLFVRWFFDIFTMSGDIKNQFVGTVLGIGFCCLGVVLFRGRRMDMMRGRIGRNPYMSNAILKAFMDDSAVSAINFPHLNCVADENVYFACPALLFEDKEKVLGYSGQSAGLRMRVTRGLSLGTGSSRGNVNRGIVRDYFKGVFVVTNKRVVFLSSKKPFEVPHTKILSHMWLDKRSFSVITKSKSFNIRMDKNHSLMAKTLILSFTNDV